MKQKKEIIDDEGEEIEEDNKEEEVEEPVNPKVKAKSPVWVVKARSTASEPVLVNSRTDDVYDVHQALAKILNNQEIIKQGLLS